MKSNLAAVFLLGVVLVSQTAADDALVVAETTAAMKRAAGFYRDRVATRGGYVYFYSLDLRQRWGEGVATKDQIWVQPPGTPTVGLAYLEAYRATGDDAYLQAATSAALALIHGQLRSGGWTNCVDLDPRGERTADYRNGRGKGKNNSSLDDGQTQSAIRFIVQADHAHQFQHKAIHKSAEVALNALMKAQYPNGGFPQVWTGPVSQQPVVAANYPAYDWRTEGQIKNYWDMYTLNDNTCGYLVDALIDAYRVYKSDRYLQSLRKLGDFLILAQMPDPQPGWAQQYNYRMQPIWARRFEPPGVSGDESQEVLETLMKIFAATEDRKYLEPIPRALAYLKRSQLPDGRLARYYELKTNRPLYMKRNGKQYSLTYDDSRLPSHYGWKTQSRLEEIAERYAALRRDDRMPPPTVGVQQVRKILSSLDGEGRWVSTYDGRRLVGQAKMPVGARYLASEVFSDNLTRLARFVQQSRR